MPMKIARRANKMAQKNKKTYFVFPTYSKWAISESIPFGINHYVRFSGLNFGIEIKDGNVVRCTDVVPATY